jgi:hypothetical protein
MHDDPDSAPKEMQPSNSPADLLARAEVFASFSMRMRNKVPPALIAVGPSGSIFFVPSTMDDVRAKDNFANVARLICIAHGATAAVLIIEAWMSVAAADGSLDLNVPPSEALNRREIVMLACETRGGCKHKILPIIRTDAGGFFGFGEDAGPYATSLQGRFTQILLPRMPSKARQEQARRLLAGMGIDTTDLRRDPFAN